MDDQALKWGGGSYKVREVGALCAVARGALACCPARLRNLRRKGVEVILRHSNPCRFGPESGGPKGRQGGVGYTKELGNREAQKTGKGSGVGKRSKTVSNDSKKTAAPAVLPAE